MTIPSSLGFPWHHPRTLPWEEKHEQSQPSSSFPSSLSSLTTTWEVSSSDDDWGDEEMYSVSSNQARVFSSTAESSAKITFSTLIGFSNKGRDPREYFDPNTELSKEESHPFIKSRLQLEAILDLLDANFREGIQKGQEWAKKIELPSFRNEAWKRIAQVQARSHLEKALSIAQNIDDKVTYIDTLIELLHDKRKIFEKVKEKFPDVTQKQVDDRWTFRHTC